MGANSCTGTGHGAADGKLRGFSLDKIHHIREKTGTQSAVEVTAQGINLKTSSIDTQIATINQLISLLNEQLTNLTLLQLIDTPDSYIGSTSGRHVLVVKADGTGVEFKKLKPNLFEEFQATFNVTINGGPFNGTKTAEKGYSIPALNVNWASTDALTYPITSVEELLMNGNTLTLDDGWQLASGGVYTPTEGITEAQEGTGFNVTLASNSEQETLGDWINWVYRIYYGNSSQETLTNVEVQALSNRLQSSKVATYTIGAAENNYKYIAWPVAYGTQSVFKDATTGFDIPMETPYQVSISNSYGVTENYYVYRSTYQLGGSINIRVS